MLFLFNNQHMSNKRITNEFNEMVELINKQSIDDHRFIEINKISEDMSNITICFLGPKETPYEELVNVITIQIPKEYPHQAPKMHFINKIFHPNIAKDDGEICLDILKDNWSPVHSLRTVMMSIISLLSDPNPDSPLNGIAANMYQESLKSTENRRKYIKKIQSYDKF